MQEWPQPLTLVGIYVREISTFGDPQYDRAVRDGQGVLHLVDAQSTRWASIYNVGETLIVPKDRL